MTETGGIPIGIPNGFEVPLMTWFRVDDGFPEHPKLADLESRPRLWAECVALWITAGCWCAKQLTDGVFPKPKLKRVVPFDGAEAAKELVRCGLWRDERNAYVFHDWEDYQPARVRVEAEREKGRTRMASWRARNAVTTHVRNGTSNGGGNGGGNGDSDAVGHPVSHAVSDAYPDPARPGPTKVLPPKGGASSAQAREASPPPEIFDSGTIASIFDQERRRAKGSRYQRTDADERRLEAAVDWAEHAADDARTSPADVVRRSIRSFVRDEKARLKGFPFAFWASDPGSYLMLAEQHQTEEQSSTYQQLREKREEAFKRGIKSGDLTEHDKLQREIDKLLGTA